MPGPVTTTYVQLAPDGSGKKVFNLRAQTTNADGTVGDVYLQGVVLMDQDGNVLDLADDEDWKTEMLAELRAIRAALEEMT